MLKRVITVARVAWDLTLRFCAKYADSGRYVAAGCLCGDGRLLWRRSALVAAVGFCGSDRLFWQRSAFVAAVGFCGSGRDDFYTDSTDIIVVFQIDGSILLAIYTVLLPLFN